MSSSKVKRMPGALTPAERRKRILITCLAMVADNEHATRDLWWCLEDNPDFQPPAMLPALAPEEVENALAWLYEQWRRRASA